MRLFWGTKNRGLQRARGQVTKRVDYRIKSCGIAVSVDRFVFQNFTMSSLRKDSTPKLYQHFCLLGYNLRGLIGISRESAHHGNSLRAFTWAACLCTATAD
jgi:hypothetical protein